MVEVITKHCKCSNPNWVVITRDGYKVNHVSGVSRTVGVIGSKYSTVRCLNCKDTWRTKAKYVDDLKDIREVL
ncbi:hypothetical protein [Clostridium butyricum]|jgi:hypothetical protein